MSQKLCKIISSTIVKTIAQTDIGKNSYGVFRSYLGPFPKIGTKKNEKYCNFFP